MTWPVALATRRTQVAIGAFIKPKASNGSRDDLDRALAAIKRMAEAGR